MCRWAGVTHGALWTVSGLTTRWGCGCTSAISLAPQAGGQPWWPWACPSSPLSRSVLSVLLLLCLSVLCWECTAIFKAEFAPQYALWTPSSWSCYNSSSSSGGLLRLLGLTVAMGPLPVCLDTCRGCSRRIGQPEPACCSPASSRVSAERSWAVGGRRTARTSCLPRAPQRSLECPAGAVA